MDEKKRAICEREVRTLMERAGVRDAVLLPSRHAGLIEIWFDGPAKDPLPRIQALCRENPFEFTGTYHWTPVEAWTEADRKHLRAYAERFDAQIGDEESWKFELHHNDAQEDPIEVRDTVTGAINHGHVDLEKPEKRVHVELIGHRAGFALLGPRDELDVKRVLRDEFVEFEEYTPPRRGAGSHRRPR